MDELENSLEEFKLKSRSEEVPDSDSTATVNKNNVFIEKSNHDRLIVFDDVSGLADDSKKFASFLTVA